MGIIGDSVAEESRLIARRLIAMNLAPAAAAVLVAQADALNERQPKLRALLSEGRIDWYTLQLVISRTEYVRDSVVADLDPDAIAERERQPTAGASG